MSHHRSDKKKGPKKGADSKESSTQRHFDDYDPHSMPDAVRRLDIARKSGVDHSEYDERQYRLQAEKQLMRSLEASKQQLFDVFAMNIGMIEEFEDLENRQLRHDGHRSFFLNRSHINNLPSQRRKSTDDLLAIIDAELGCFQMQVHHVNKFEDREHILKNLVKTILLWLSHREEMQVPQQMCDDFVINVLETLIQSWNGVSTMQQVKGPKGQHIRSSESDINDAMGHFTGAKHKQAVQDREYRDKKKAELMTFRRGTDVFPGFTRVIRLRPSLEGRLRDIFERPSLQ